MKKIRPIIRMIGTKYRLFNQIYKLFNFNNINNFYDVFGGSFIVGVNVKNLNENINVYLNDYDQILPFDKEFVIKNNQSFNGYGTITKAAIKQFETKVKNGFWNKFEIYKSITEKCFWTHSHYKELIQKNYSDQDFLYFDPPYFKNFKAYKHQLDPKEVLVDIIEFSTKNPNTKIAISFIDFESIKDMFSNSKWKIHRLRHKNTNTTNFYKTAKIAKEILITNYE